MSVHGPTTHSFVSQRLRLRYVDWGNPEAPPLILVHGGRDHSRSWDWLAQELREDWHVICPDLRGHGESDWSSDGDYPIAAHVYDFAQLIHMLGYEQVTIVAHSLGGNIATRFTGLYPEKVSRLINIEGLGFPKVLREQLKHKTYPEQMRSWIKERRRHAGLVPRRYPNIDAAFARMKEANPFLSDDQARHLTIHAANCNEDGTWSWKYDPMLGAWNPSDPGYSDVCEAWAAITCPILMLWGKESPFSSPDEDGRIVHFQNARLKVYENAGHWLHHDQFDRFLADVRAFLAE